MKEELLESVLEAERELYIRPEDKIVFVVDDPDLPEILARVFAANDFETAIIPPRTRPSEDYAFDDSLLKGKTVAFLVTGMSISHSPPTRRMMEKTGLFLISNPGIMPDWPSVLNPVNRIACERNGAAIFRKIGGDVGGEIHITADDGTDLRLSVPNRNWFAETGRREGELGTNGPFGLFSSSPFQANGIYALEPGDFLTNPINKVREEIQFFIENNRIEEITGHDQAGVMKTMLDAPNNPLAYNLAEVGIGMNPGRPNSLLRSVIAEKVAGAILVATGTNFLCLKPDCPEIDLFKHKRYSANVHIDGIKLNATCTINGHKIVEEGRLVV